MKDITRLKHQKEYFWLNEAPASALNNSVKDLDVAYKNFFRSIKDGSSDSRYPRFKKKEYDNSFRVQIQYDNVIRGHSIFLPKVGLVKARGIPEIDGRVLSATISQTSSGKYFVSLCCTDVNIQELENTGAVIGLKMGTDYLAVTSNGHIYDNPKFYEKNLDRLAELQRELSKKKRNSNNREKARVKVAKLHEHIANQRKDLINKITTELINNYDIICIEDLGLSKKLKEKEFSLALSDVALGEFRRQLEYKADWYGKVIVIVDVSEFKETGLEAAKKILKRGLKKIKK